MTTEVVLAWHIHQPEFVPDEELREQCRESYRNVLRVHREHDAPFCLNVTGSLLERLGTVAPDLRQSMVSLADDGLLEPLASGYNHPLIPILPYESAREHVARDVAAKERVFGARPAGFWPTDLGWVHWMVPLLREFDVEWSVVDSTALTEGNALSAWEGTEESGHAVLDPQVEATTARRELHVPYQTAFDGDRLGVLLRDHQRSVELFGSDLGGSGTGALYDEDALVGFVEAIVETPGDLVCLGEDGERLNPQTIRLYAALLDRLTSRDDVRLRTGTAALSDADVGRRRFFPASTFQHDLRAWDETMDDRSYRSFLSDVQRRVAALERHTGGTESPATPHLERARDALLRAEDSGVVFWHYAERTRRAGYEAAMAAYRHTQQGFDSL